MPSFVEIILLDFGLEQNHINIKFSLLSKMFHAKFIAGQGETQPAYDRQSPKAIVSAN